MRTQGGRAGSSRADLVGLHLTFREDSSVLGRRCDGLGRGVGVLRFRLLGKNFFDGVHDGI